MTRRFCSAVGEHTEGPRIPTTWVNSLDGLLHYDHRIADGSGVLGPGQVFPVTPRKTPAPQKPHGDKPPRPHYLPLTRPTQSHRQCWAKIKSASSPAPPPPHPPPPRPSPQRGVVRLARAPTSANCGTDLGHRPGSHNSSRSLRSPKKTFKNLDRRLGSDLNHFPQGSCDCPDRVRV